MKKRKLKALNPVRPIPPIAQKASRPGGGEVRKFIELDELGAHSDIVLRAAVTLNGERSEGTAAVLQFLRALAQRVNPAGKTLEQLLKEDVEARAAAEAMRLKQEEEVKKAASAVKG